MTRLALLAPWLASGNLGDQGIGDAAQQALWLRGFRVEAEYTTQQRPATRRLTTLLKEEKLILAGSNALGSSMERRFNFWVTPDLALAYRHKVVLFGVGWGKYSSSLSTYSRWVISTILDPQALHSVRDSYTARKLQNLGLQTITTGCPTLWSVPDMTACEVSAERTAVVTVSHYDRNPSRDRTWIEQVGEFFADWKLQPMGLADQNYAQDVLGVPADRILCPTLTSYDSFLHQEQPVFLGTRLHAGIRSLQHGNPTVIIAIDNRAIEMGKDFNLPVFDSRDVAGLLEKSRTLPTGAILTAEQRARVDEYFGRLCETSLGQA